MPAAHRLGDSNTGHDACPATAITSASPDVFVNGSALARVGDPYGAHGCVDHPTHTPTVASGSATVFINGIPAARVGDSVSCGGSAAVGSSNVYIGG